jgi:hypothetical protein
VRGPGLASPRSADIPASPVGRLVLTFSAAYRLDFSGLMKLVKSIASPFASEEEAVFRSEEYRMYPQGKANELIFMARIRCAQ